jgi:hypothetical protein
MIGSSHIFKLSRALTYKTFGNNQENIDVLKKSYLLVEIFC